MNVEFLSFKRNYAIEICEKSQIYDTDVFTQRKRTAHERAKELYSSGEFSSGRKWADDAPKEKVDTYAVNLIDSGACGAFVHGLEDEMFGRSFFVLFCFISFCGPQSYSHCVLIKKNPVVVFIKWPAPRYLMEFCISLRRGAYRCGGGSVHAGPVLFIVCREVPGFPGGHVQ